MEISQAAPAAGDAHPSRGGAVSAAPPPRHPASAWHGARREASGEGATRRGTEPRGASGPPQALTEDDEEPDDKSHDGEDQPPVADGVIVWGGGEPSGRQPGRGVGLSPQCRAHGQAWEWAARPAARSPRAARVTHSP